MYTTSLTNVYLLSECLKLVIFYVRFIYRLNYKPEQYLLFDLSVIMTIVDLQNEL